MVEQRQEMPEENPYREAIVEAMRWVGEPMTVVDVAYIFLEEKSAQFLRFHLRQLHSHGKVELAGTCKVRGVTVRRYRLAGSAR